MLKRLFSMVAQNLILSFRNSLMWVLLGTLVVMIIVVRFFMPAEYSVSQRYFIFDDTENKFIESKLDEDRFNEKSFCEDQAALENSVKTGSNAIGIIFRGDPANPHIEIVHQSTLSEQNMNVIKAACEEILTIVMGEPQKNVPEIKFLRNRTSPPPKNIALVSVLMTFEVLILGFLLIAVFIFQEKSDGSIRAYRVTPGGTILYISSKTLAFLIIGIVYGGVLALTTTGFSVNSLELSAVTILGFVLYTLIGMIVASFFNNISEWFFIGILILLVNMVPVFSHEFPAFSPGWISGLPSYTVLYCYDEIFFPTGKSLLSPIALLALEAAVSYVICHFIVGRKLMKEGRS